VRSLSVIHREDCPTLREELRVLNVVHCGNTLKYPEKNVNN
jgi:hypothetical protein